MTGPKLLALAAAAYFAWRAFKYTYLIARTNRQNKEWLDVQFPEHKATNASVADAHRRSTVVDYVLAALACALVAYLL